MKRWIPVILLALLAAIFAACGSGSAEPDDPNANVTGITHDKEGFTFYTYDPSEPDTTPSYRVEELTAALDQVVVEDGVNKYVYTVDGETIVKAEYALRFGDAQTALDMMEYYESNGYTEPYCAGRVDGAYLILEFSDPSQFDLP